ncbi:hypothetical protein V9T20_02355 [Halobacterium salinarum]|uniref:hypothetical protein n=1 Tax=Halobacterium salinarum TaxID=2242 RepID=UPI0030CAEE98
MVSSKPYHLINYEKEYAMTGSAPEDSSYRDHELRSRVQDKADRIDDRLTSLSDDVNSISLLSDVTINTLRSPRELGNLIGEIVSDLLVDNDLDSHSDFLSGVIEGLDSVAPHDHVTKSAGREHRTELLERTQEKTTKQLNQQVEGTEEWWDDNTTKERNTQDAREFIQRVLEHNDLCSSDFVIQQVQFEMLDGREGRRQEEWNPKDALSEASILEIVDRESLEERAKLRRQIGEDMKNLQSERRGQSRQDVFEYIATRKEEQPIHTDDFVRAGQKLGDRSVVVTILNDLAGETGRREGGYDQVRSANPLLRRIDDNEWETTAYGDIIADWLFGEGLRLPDTTKEKQVDVVKELEDSAADK